MLICKKKYLQLYTLVLSSEGKKKNIHFPLIEGKGEILLRLFFSACYNSSINKRLIRSVMVV